jgi:hypothetical protein
MSHLKTASFENLFLHYNIYEDNLFSAFFREMTQPLNLRNLKISEILVRYSREVKIPIHTAATNHKNKCDIL